MKRDDVKVVKVLVCSSLLTLFTMTTMASAADRVVVVPLGGTVGNAVASDVIKGKIFSSKAAGKGVSGTLDSNAVSTGDATTGEVLKGKTFSGDSGNGLTGTMSNIGKQNITPSTLTQTIHQGYHNGTGSVVGDSDLVSGNIKYGKSIYGVEGSALLIECGIVHITCFPDPVEGCKLDTSSSYTDDFCTAAGQNFTFDYFLSLCPHGMDSDPIICHCAGRARALMYACKRAGEYVMFGP